MTENKARILTAEYRLRYTEKQATKGEWKSMKYEIKYTKNEHEISMIREAETALGAIERLCDQYGWRCKLSQYDADSRGLEWAEAYADTDGGINFSLRIVAVCKQQNGKEV